MTKEIEVALNVLKAYEYTRKNGILSILKFDFVCKDFEFMTEVFSICLQKKIENNQIYEILNNYEDDFENKKIHKLIVNGLMCILNGDDINYLIELSASIIGKKSRIFFLNSVEENISKSDLNESVINKYNNKQPFSINTNLLKNISLDSNKIRIAINKMNNMEVKHLLIGVSGENAKKIINELDSDMIRFIEEDAIVTINEDDIITAEKKFISFIENI